MPDPENKAVAFNSLVSVLREVVSPSSVAALLRALPPETAALIDNPPLPMRWLPYIHTFTLVRTACNRLYSGDEERTSDLSRKAVLRDTGSIYRLFIKLASPGYVMERAARLWETYWRNNGTVEVIREGDQGALVQYQGMQHATSLFWTMQCGSLRGLMDATGVKNGEAQIVGERNDPTCCTIRTRWR